MRARGKIRRPIASSLTLNRVLSSKLHRTYPGFRNGANGRRATARGSSCAPVDGSNEALSAPARALGRQEREDETGLTPHEYDSPKGTCNVKTLREYHPSVQSETSMQVINESENCSDLLEAPIKLERERFSYMGRIQGLLLEEQD